MCGIVGIVGARGPVDPAVLSAMRDRLAHRGPDDAGIAFSRDGLTGFGHRRLAILDPSPAGHQPMWNRAGTLVTTYNGEIYNFRELAAELSKHGYTFLTRSDTEVLLAAFEHWGLDAVERFQGMFAFALWSEEMQECVLVRDRLGVKPLYYAVDGETLYFASEATALHEVRPKELDSAALGDYLAYGYVPGERTIWRGIMKLRPGHLLVFGTHGPIIRRYWSPPSSPDPNTPRAPGVLRQELAAAVEQALVSDVPVGAFLSGGLDSSTLVALAAGAGTELHSYTIDFDHGRTAGAALARQVAERYHTDHHERLLSLDTSLELMREVSAAYDEPLADESIVPTYVIAGEVARDLKVVLSGDGGDEIFAGYRWYAPAWDPWALRSRAWGAISPTLARRSGDFGAGSNIWVGRRSRTTFAWWAISTGRSSGSSSTPRWRPSSPRIPRGSTAPTGARSCRSSAGCRSWTSRPISRTTSSSRWIGPACGTRSRPACRSSTIGSWSMRSGSRPGRCTRPGPGS
jgi:asparagine synthase (glutamine-hydrolysing)